MPNHLEIGDDKKFTADYTENSGLICANCEIGGEKTENSRLTTEQSIKTN